MQHTRDQKGTVEVDGELYDWELRRQPRRTTGNNWEGIAVSLWLQGYKREAIIQFPMPMRANGHPDLEKQKVNVDYVKNAVTAAIEAGWEPTSRGKAVEFDVDAQGR